jgi:hypothetical protein
VSLSRFRIKRVKVDTVFAGKQLEDLIEVGADFVAVARAAWITASRHDATGIDWRVL